MNHQARPTSEQIKELWGRYLVKEENENGYYWWRDGGGDLVWYGYDSYPTIDLNRLFKYAVPGAVTILFENGHSLRYAYETLFKMWLDKWVEGYEIDDALFYALYEVMNGTTNKT